MNKEKKERYDKAYMEIAKVLSGLSYCKRKQVGALIVKDYMIISEGFNGMPKGFDNKCEDEENKTKWEVLHAEANAISKVARSTNSCKNAILYVTHSPCKDCSKLIVQSGIKHVIYDAEYKDLEGISFLENAGITVDNINI